MCSVIANHYWNENFDAILFNVFHTSQNDSRLFVKKCKFVIDIKMFDSSLDV